MPAENRMWIEWIPNISTGDPHLITEIENIFRQIPELYLLHTDRGPEVNRTVFTLVGTMYSLHQALFDLVSVLSQKLDMSLHQGTHPRLGALDVCPYVRLINGNQAILVKWVNHMAGELSKSFDLPVYLYEHSAISSLRHNLADIRRGEYEGLAQKMQQSDWIPDFGDKFHPGLGATVMGVRDFLIAYNVNLDTANLSVANAIARQIRSKGNSKRPHSLPGVKAIGWYLKDEGFCQISTNITRIHQSSPWDVYTHCRTLASEFDTRVTGSELIGLIPYQTVRQMISQSGYDTKLLARQLGLAYAGIDDLLERIIEYNVYIGTGKTLFKEFFKEK